MGNSRTWTSTPPPPDFLAAYMPAGRWVEQFADWSDIRECPRTDTVRRLWCDDGVVRLGYWGTHEFTGKECWLSAIDPTLELVPRYVRDLVRPPGVEMAANAA